MCGHLRHSACINAPEEAVALEPVMYISFPSASSSPWPLQPGGPPAARIYAPHTISTLPQAGAPVTYTIHTDTMGTTVLLDAPTPTAFNLAVSQPAVPSLSTALPAIPTWRHRGKWPLSRHQTQTMFNTITGLLGTVVVLLVVGGAIWVASKVCCYRY
ncbi:hypothetical protein DFH09DRAFT_1324314 [Mycena vulgaris]|nr:hypothetical protein DFH09DRAFT_1324314 [Mycena vulgaris]